MEQGIRLPTIDPARDFLRLAEREQQAAKEALQQANNFLSQVKLIEADEYWANIYPRAREMYQKYMSVYHSHQQKATEYLVEAQRTLRD